MGKETEAQSFVKFLISILMPAVLIIAGAGVVALGFGMSSLAVIIIGAVMALAGVLWGAFLMLWHGPVDLL